jgi:putative transposase
MASDITYIRTHEGFLCLAVVIDLFSRRVIGWSMQGRAYTDLPLQALLMAVWRRKPKTKVHVHSDQGSQFTSYAWQECLEQHNVAPSVSRRANCWERAIEGAIGSSPMASAVVESFFKSLKAELVWRRNWQPRRDVDVAIFEYINGFDNPRRRHSALGRKSPVAVERKAA